MSEITIERLERARALCAYLVVRDGPVAVPWFERLERELATMRQTQDTVERAKLLQESYGGPATRRAIEPPNSEQQLLAQVQNLVIGNVELPRYVERSHRDGILSFSFCVGRLRIQLPNDPTTLEFRAAYSAALVDAIAMENDSDE
jgi:hypothetical protein